MIDYEIIDDNAINIGDIYRLQTVGDIFPPTFFKILSPKIVGNCIAWNLVELDENFNELGNIEWDREDSLLNSPSYTKVT